MNVGDVAGREVVQLYYTAPYISGGIEKSHVVLGDFAKTEVIEPSETKQVKLEITAQSMASYDCYDRNTNSHTGYELDEGEYVLRLMKNSHVPAIMTDGGASTVKFKLDAKVNYDTDEKTGNPVVNRFTGNDTIDGYPIDIVWLWVCSSWSSALCPIAIFFSLSCASRLWSIWTPPGTVVTGICSWKMRLMWWSSLLTESMTEGGFKLSQRSRKN